jgi:hypothetical protein
MSFTKLDLHLPKEKHQETINKLKKIREAMRNSPEESK